MEQAPEQSVQPQSQEPSLPELQNRYRLFNEMRGERELHKERLEDEIAKIKAEQHKLAEQLYPLIEKQQQEQQAQAQAQAVVPAQAPSADASASEEESHVESK